MVLRRLRVVITRRWRVWWRCGAGRWRETERPRVRPRVDGFAEKIAEWVERSRGRVGADVAHERLVAMAYLGSERPAGAREGQNRSPGFRSHD
jgi:hypothetical protein